MICRTFRAHVKLSFVVKYIRKGQMKRLLQGGPYPKCAAVRKLIYRDVRFLQLRIKVFYEAIGSIIPLENKRICQKVSSRIRKCFAAPKNGISPVTVHICDVPQVID